MKKTIAACALGSALSLAAVSQADAAAYLKSTGSGTACSLAAPCAVMNEAIAAAGSGGLVYCLDRGNYSGFVFLNITQSVTISCGDGMWVGTGTAVNINPPAGSRVIVEGLNSDGQSSVNTINFTGQGTLQILKSRVTNNTSAARGLSFTPSGPAQLLVSDSSFLNTAGEGIYIWPSAAATKAEIRNTVIHGSGLAGISVGVHATVSLYNVTASSNSDGLSLIGLNSKVSVRNSVFSNNARGVFSRSVLDFTSSSASLNTTGIVSSGLGGKVTIAESRVFGNQTGLSVAAGGQIFTFRNNEVNANTVDGNPTAPPIALK